ncbi:sepiapterin reductase family protein [Maudiozyma humilis]|uniref:Sepiapterin reductase family protein n=1 Tax=Maudiozyma humilis TaxID=51915 RepID=A0AAV5RVQ8_MAUHU|nr:sepiapterin reductase family protein [Kazachstania humilis]
MPAKVIIVTGVSRGIGRSIVDTIFKEEPETIVYGIARSEAPLKELKEQYGDHFFYIVGDITDAGKLKQLAADAVRDHGKIDSVVANAGVLEPVQRIHDADIDAWKRLYDINFFSIVSLVSITVEQIARSHGNYVFVSSDASTMYFSNWGAYGSSKAALNHLALTVANEEPNVRCLAVAPGIVDTSMQVNIRENVGNNMSAEHHAMFKDLKESNKLLDSNVPATVYANLALRGVPESINGTYVSYDCAELASFQK